MLTPDTSCTVSYYFGVQYSMNDDYKIDYEIYGPDDPYRPFISRNQEQQGEWEFLAEHKGEYAFCFYGGRQHDKIVEIDIQYTCEVDQDARRQRRDQRKQQRNLDDDETEELQRSLEDKVDSIERQLYILEKNLSYYKSRNSRNNSTVESTVSRIQWFSFYGILLICGMSFAQITLLQFLFKQSRSNAV
ncbi:hypothetical protein TBLA_0F00710 [Henningerozyma blattae CBS 6284]|uniref:GOLD domain-containing protein n=1 Tax=Henningerozyma blattae (strain ATCC 34711 / CBS 6284 / DSM 70876 / NBRC 10599 / NRRL Y-10934 / UCD 77-7) TaxID=1071380 RepID=I2H5G4_HENB6|nr:hypothetical protein TBLA_0F00710 [Tetrapisispora blattae CBS 6284]CCH61616.1 hypothetical protein TBLA_0F00710 [Tetrapisispora blattae CBS 6284]